MAITYGTPTRHGNVTVVTVTSDLGGTVWYHWYVDGSWIGVTLVPRHTFVLEDTDDVEIVVHDTNDENYDAVANAPAGWPARKTVWWTAPADADVDHYVVRQKEGAGAWTDLAAVDHDGSWAYGFLTPRLTDLASYTWRVVPVDAAGNEGTAKEIGPETVVRRPDSVDFSMSFDSGTDKVTFDIA